MAMSNFIPGVWSDLLKLEMGKVTVAEHFGREYAREKREAGYELVDLPAEWVEAREAFWAKFQSLTAEGVDAGFIDWVADEGYEKTPHMKHLVKKESA